MFIMKKLPSQVPSSTEIKEKHDLHNLNFYFAYDEYATLYYYFGLDQATAD